MSEPKLVSLLGHIKRAKNKIKAVELANLVDYHYEKYETSWREKQIQHHKTMARKYHSQLRNC